MVEGRLQLVSGGYINVSKVSQMLGSTPSGFSSQELGYQTRPNAIKEVFKNFVDDGVLISVDELTMKSVDKNALGGLYYRIAANGMSIFKEKTKAIVLD